MAKTHHNKLIRDRIPDIIAADGRTSDITILSEAEYANALRQKLIEEATEAAAAHDNDLIKELADLQEVMDALIHLKNITPETVQAAQQKRREQRGGFEKRIYLSWTE